MLLIANCLWYCLLPRAAQPTCDQTRVASCFWRLTNLWPTTLMPTAEVYSVFYCWACWRLHMVRLQFWVNEPSFHAPCIQSINKMNSKVECTPLINNGDRVMRHCCWMGSGANNRWLVWVSVFTYLAIGLRQTIEYRRHLFPLEIPLDERLSGTAHLCFLLQGLVSPLCRVLEVLSSPLPLRPQTQLVLAMYLLASLCLLPKCLLHVLKFGVWLVVTHIFVVGDLLDWRLSGAW